MKRISGILAAWVLAVSITGCDKYLDKLDNPNLVKEPPLNGLLTTSTYQTAYDAFLMGDITSYYTQYLASNSKASDGDIYNEVDYSNTWESFYATMMNIQQMITKAEANKAYKHLGVGKILMAYNLNMLINSFGDVPFSEALKGLDLLIPTFDKQADLHQTCLTLLSDGIADLNKQDVSMDLNSNNDLIHKGSVSAWIKTANALKARFLTQFSKTPGYNPTEVLNTLTNAYESNEDDAALTVFDGRSPWNAVSYANTQLDLDGWLSTQYVDALNGTTYGVVDPRLALIASKTKFGDYRGTPNGAGRIGTGTDDEESYLWINGYYSKGNAPLWLVTYAEMKFIEAEAAFRANDPQTAYNAYLDGIRLHMEKVGVATADRNAYLNNPAVAVGKDNLTLNLIFKEKYVVMFLNPEAWVDARRFDYKYKDFTLPQNAAMNSFIRRLAYPTVETSRNGKNVPPVAGLDERLIWDK
ncbi:SusD/RagB family nutrient-binding outer membrane lipoprotein [Pseudobacter ginsenosidimutans]|uniref:SusD-like starch-binding protein associating with outer membrane n=1 Tax=Pseudobacter ginsenosidimutans TaxID=661488 RepID=A0A4Q7N695_9BACT|nr:SusD/RagB family nutrient-binding outer membrane lipoprotein [Pseudobacter ginsenosidimutans]QEC45113.1 SusD/RagB family nutrient-binding outer membrane lipoprotein [Pseudobacter ginsenosidimutans]RZS76608.1 SusD-like starch-binding protein associating with outer membrane [Pseudobacter ginsenosidimutans]